MRDRDTSIPFTFTSVRVVAVTAKALLCDFGDSPETDLSGEVWIPLSQVSDTSELDGGSEREDVGTLAISEWIATEKGLV